MADISFIALGFYFLWKNKRRSTVKTSYLIFIGHTCWFQCTCLLFDTLMWIICSHSGFIPTNVLLSRLESSLSFSPALVRKCLPAAESIAVDLPSMSGLFTPLKRFPLGGPHHISRSPSEALLSAGVDAKANPSHFTFPPWRKRADPPSSPRLFPCSVI